MKTLVAGATSNPDRYAYKAAEMLEQAGYSFYLVGRKAEMQGGRQIYALTDAPSFADIHTISLYVGPAHQEKWLQYILALNPKRVIFNPGTENGAFMKTLEARGIATLEACTLVLLTTGQYKD